MLKIDIISVQPKMFEGFLRESMVARAVKKGACEINIIDLRDFGEGRWKKVDDKPYGGGPGMLMKCGPWFDAVEHCKPEGARVIMTNPAGRVFNERFAEELAGEGHLIFMCGHYEGFDARIETLATDQASLGDFVMTGGELAAAAMVDAVVRLLPGVLGGGPQATASESFSRESLLEAPQYTHPPEFRGMKVPEVLISGDHMKIEAWKKSEARKLTQARRPDLLATCLAAVLAASAVWADQPDKRQRIQVMPTRIVAMSEGLQHADDLLKPRYGQISEGIIFEGSGPVLKKGDWVLLDFGRELDGTLQVESGGKGAQGASLHYRLGESVAEALSPLGEKGSTNDHAIRDEVMRVPFLGRRETGESGFRFAWLKNEGDIPVQLEAARAIELTRGMKQLGSFTSSDERLNRVWKTAAHTVELCCQDYLWDGIKRDRLVWMGDTHPETMSILAVFGAASVLPESLDYAQATTPTDRWMNTMANYTLWWIRNLAEWYRFTGDKAYLAAKGDYLEGTVDHVAQFVKDGAWIGDRFLDWPTQHNTEAGFAGSQALCLMAMREAAFLGRELNRPSLEKKAETLVAALAKQHPTPHGAKSAAALLALSGLAEPPAMYREVLGRDGHNGVSTFYGYYMLEAMSAAGENARALDTVRDYWGGMLDMGATSFWEDFQLAWTNNAFRIDEMPVKGKKDVHGDYGEFCYQGFRHSLCHGWSSGPAAWCLHHILGIEPQGVGLKVARVKPNLGDLAWAEGTYPLPDGQVIKVRAEKDAQGHVKTTVQAPAGIVIQKD